MIPKDATSVTLKNINILFTEKYQNQGYIFFSYSVERYWLNYFYFEFQTMGKKVKSFVTIIFNYDSKFILSFCNGYLSTLPEN